MQQGSLELDVLNHLRQSKTHRESTHNLTLATQTVKSKVNRALYNLQTKGVIRKIPNSHPVVWELVIRDMPISARTWIYIDLTNVHDCFQPVSLYADSVFDTDTPSIVCVKGIGSPEYNHWTPPNDMLNKKRVEFVQYCKDTKDMAMLTMLSLVLADLQGRDGLSERTIVLCSKNKAVHSIETLLKEQCPLQLLHGNRGELTVHVAKDWDQLRLLL